MRGPAERERAGSGAWEQGGEANCGGGCPVTRSGGSATAPPSARAAHHRLHRRFHGLRIHRCCCFSRRVQARGAVAGEAAGEKRERPLLRKETLCSGRCPLDLPVSAAIAGAGRCSGSIAAPAQGGERQNRRHSPGASRAGVARRAARRLAGPHARADCRTRVAARRRRRSLPLIVLPDLPTGRARPQFLLVVGSRLSRAPPLPPSRRRPSSLTRWRPPPRPSWLLA